MAISQVSNVLVSSTTGDTFNALHIHAVKVVAGGSAGRVTLAASGVTFFDSGSVAANTAPYADEIDVSLSQGQTITITITGGATAYIYTR